jgi:putative peptidoglycan lipid II flippase
VAGDSRGAERPSAGSRAEVSRLGAVAALLAASVFLSRVSGYLRDLVLANRAGAGAETDAYFIAFLLPDLLNYLLAGGALAIAFIPVYTRIRERRGEEAAGQLFATVLGGLGVLALAGTVALWVFAEDIGRAQLTGFDDETRQLSVHLARIMLPAQIAFITGGILRAVLMAHGRFGSQAAAPLLYNGCVIAGGLIGDGVEGFAWGVLVGAVLGNWLVPLWELRRVRVVRLRLAPLDRDFRHYLWVALPLMVGISLATVDEWYEKFLGAALEVGSVSFLGYARKLMMLPVAVIGQALGAAALPVLAQLHSSGRGRELNELLVRSLRVALGLGILAGAGVFALSGPIVEFFFRQGRFDSQSALAVSHLLAVMALATPAWVVQQVAIRAFYAREDSWRPMLLGTGIALAVIPLYLALRGSRGVEGLALAGVIAMSLNALATLVWARVRHGAPRVSPLVDTFARNSLIAVAAAAAATALQQHGTGRSGAALDLALGGAGFAVVAIGGVLLVGDPALRELARSLARRLRGSFRKRP